jgi:hypothetical protein
MFRDPTEWLNHMQRQHTTVWSCLFGGHENIVKDTREELEDHLRSAHGDTISGQQLQTLVQSCARPHPDTFAVLHFDSQGASQAGVANKCLICGEDFANKESTVPRNIQDHYLEHLETLALLALPDREDVDEPEGSQWQENVNDPITTLDSSENALVRYLNSLELTTSATNEELIEREDVPGGPSSIHDHQIEMKPNDMRRDFYYLGGTDRQRIIVSIDFGTSYSALAWAVTGQVSATTPTP